MRLINRTCELIVAVMFIGSALPVGIALGAMVKWGMN